MFHFHFQEMKDLCELQIPYILYISILIQGQSKTRIQFFIRIFNIVSD